jgi:hypothetical protein
MLIKQRQWKTLMMVHQYCRWKKKKNGPSQLAEEARIIIMYFDIVGRGGAESSFA